MAKIGEIVFDFKDVLKSSRVPVSCAEDQWFLNVGRNSVVNVRDMKTLHTWTLMHPHYFTDSVVHSSGYLFCVMDKKILLKWSVDEDNLKNAERIEFQDSIFTVIALNDSNQLILFESGKFAVIEPTFSDTKAADFDLLQENEEFIWANACMSETATEIFCFVKNQKNENRFLRHLTVKGESTAIHSCSVAREDASLKCWCLNPFDLSILSLWSDGMICSHNIKESKTEELVKIKDIDSKTIVAVDNFHPTHVAVAKGHPKQQECSLEIWDLKCSILKASKILKTPNLSSIQIAAEDSYIFLCFEKELIAVDFHVEDLTYAAALRMAEGTTTFECYSWQGTKVIPDSSIDDSEPMQISQANQDSVDSIQVVAEKLMNKGSSDLKCIPESELVRLLRLAIRHYKGENADKKDVEKYLYTVLNITFSTRFNDVFLMKCLRKMDLDEALAALQLLLSYIDNTLLPADIVPIPSSLQIADWITIIIQSHTEAFMLSKDKRIKKLFKQCDKALALIQEEYEDKSCTLTNFSISEKKHMLPQKCSDGKYCIENIDIGEEAHVTTEMLRCKTLYRKCSDEKHCIENIEIQ